MALLGDAAITMWADFAPEIVPELGDWHTHEHMPERLGIPGFLRGTRWSGGGAGAATSSCTSSSRSCSPPGVPRATEPADALVRAHAAPPQHGADPCQAVAVPAQVSAPRC
jgi:hypothetical protein